MFADWSAHLAANPPAAHVAVGDYDSSPAVLAVGHGPTQLLRWRAGRLTGVAPRLVADADATAVGAVAADVDGDGREEWSVATAAGHPDRLFARSPGGWHDLLADPAHRKATTTLGGGPAVAFDRRGTGRYTVAIGGDRLRLIEADAAGRLHDVAPTLGLDVAGVGGLWAGPLVSDRPDLFVLAAGRPNRLFTNTGDGHFSDADRCGLADPAEHGRGIAALDADADGRLDLLVGNWHGPNRLLVRQVDGTFRDRATPALAMPGAVVGVFAADFDNCGHEELFLHLDGEPNRLFRHTADGWRLTDPGPATLQDGPGTGGCVADLNGDGTLELLLAGDRLSLFHAPNTNHWLRVQPLTRFGAPARGATVRLAAAGRTQVRVIDGGPNEPVAHFGLGSVDRVEAVAVTWPDGARATVAAPGVRQTLTLRHPDG